MTAMNSHLVFVRTSHSPNITRFYTLLFSSSVAGVRLKPHMARQRKRLNSQTTVILKTGKNEQKSLIRIMNK